MEGRQAWVEKKSCLLLALLSIYSGVLRSIDTGHLRHLAVYTLATKILQGNKLLTDDDVPGVMIPRLLPALESSVHPMTCMSCTSLAENRE